MRINRTTYITGAVFAYIVSALAWIFLSDQLLTVFVDIKALVWLSTAKGVFFVLASGACFAVALQAVPGSTAATAATEEPLLVALTHRIKRQWWLYAVAIILTVAVVVVRMLIQTPTDRPFLILFMLPIMLSALLGGFGPGLTATLTAAILSAYLFLAPIYSFTIADTHERFQWAILLFNGLVISLISEAVHRLRHREQMRRQQLEAANLALSQSEERFHRLFDDAPVAIGLASYEGRIVAQNSHFERLFGYTLAEIPTIDHWWPLAYPDPEYRARVQQQWEAALAKSEGEHEAFDAGNYRVTCKDGSERQAHVFSIRMPEGLLTAFLDETEQRRAENQLRIWAESFERAELGLVLTDARSNAIITVNPAFARQRGYPREEMTGMPVFQLFPPDCVTQARTIINTLQHASHGLFETEHVTRDGRRFPVMLDVTAISDQDGQPSHRVAYVLDITERKQAEQALAEALATQKRGRIAALNQMQDANGARTRAEEAFAALKESEERLTLFIEHAPAALAMFDREMRYLAVSRRWRDDYSLGGGRLIGQSHYHIFPEIGDEWKDVHQRGLAGEVIRNDEDRFVRQDGQVQWLRWEVLPWHTAAGSVGGIVIFSEDITRFKQAQEEIRQLNLGLERRVAERTAELTAANRELDSFAYAVSHDLRAPLRAINGFTQALIEDYGATVQGEARMYLDQITLGSRRMGELIDGLLQLSRSTRGELNRRPIDLSASAKRFLEAMAKEEPDRAVQWEIEPGLVAQGDSAMLEVVMQNLLANAWKYTGHREQASIRVFSRPDETGRCICIGDNGAGFDQKHADKLFQPFQRLHRQDEFPGIGIGLATVQRIIHRHGGRLNAEGERDKGATFCFLLPNDHATPPIPPL